jgi:2-oxo-4-hydroxy-4-carboxy--5-ureidoimidazoline (OHCU) decarboxylase
MTTPSLPPPSTLPTLSDEALKSTLDLLFEPSPNLHAHVLPLFRLTRPTSYDDLISTVRVELQSLASASAKGGEDENMDLLYSILGSHPRLGEKKEEVVLSGLSSAEQRHLNQEENDAEAEELARLNREYEARFPGLRFVTWVRGRPRGEVMEEMRRRIARGDVREEERDNINVSFAFASWWYYGILFVGGRMMLY